MDKELIEKVKKDTGCKDETIIKNWLRITNYDVNRTINVINKMKQFTDCVDDKKLENETDVEEVVSNTCYCGDKANENETDKIEGHSVDSYEYKEMFDQYILELRGIKEAIINLTETIRDKNGKN